MVKVAVKVRELGTEEEIKSKRERPGISPFPFWLYHQLPDSN